MSDAPPADPAREALTRLVRNVPDFPEPGVMFKDITPLLADPDGFGLVVTALAASGRDASGTTVDAVVGMEARGFILAAPVALELGVGFVPVRKAGKLPGATYSVTYELEYAQATLQIHTDALAPGARVLVIDDVLATGGTVEATCELVRACGATPVTVAVLMELSFLGGRDRLAGVPLAALLTV